MTPNCKNETHLKAKKNILYLLYWWCHYYWCN